MSDWLSGWYWGLQTVSLVLVALTVVIGGLAILAGRRANKLQEEKILALQTSLSEAREKQAEAEAHLETVRKKQSPRGLVFDSDLFVSALAGKPAGTVEILFKPDDEDAHSLAYAIYSSLRRARWPAGLPPKRIPSGSEPARLLLDMFTWRVGVAVISNKDPKATTEKDSASDALCVALEQAGVKTKLWQEVSLADDEFEIIVGSKP